MKLIFEESVKGKEGYSLPKDLFDDIKLDQIQKSDDLPSDIILSVNDVSFWGCC